MLALLPFLACHGPEQNIDRTELSGAVIIPPVRVTEDAANDDKNELDGVDMGTVTYRYMVATGSASSFGVDDKGFPTGDGDGYLFTVADDGTSFDILLEYPYALTDTGKFESTVYEVDIYSADGSTFYGYTTTDGQQGLLIWPQTLAGGTYVAIVYGLTSDGGDDSYTLTLTGLDPNSTTVMVGAYESGDFETLGPPVAGTTVAEFVPDEEDAETWVGNFHMPPGLRTTTTCVVGTEGCAEAKTVDSGPKDSGPKDSGDSGPKDTGDTGTKDTGTKDTGGADTGGADTGGLDTAGTDTGEAATRTTVVEGVDQVYIVAGTFSSLNAVGLSPGVFYASDIQELDTANETSHKDIVVALDTAVPKPIGWTAVEKEPNDAFDGGLKIVDISLANVLPKIELGLTNAVLGVQTYPAADPKYVGDIDAFEFVVPKDGAAVFKMSWPEKDTNIDMYLFDGSGTPIMAAYNKGLGDVNPEVMTTDDLGSLLKGGQTYYLGVFPWTGPPGDHAYKIEIAIQ